MSIAWGTFRIPTAGPHPGKWCVGKGGPVPIFLKVPPMIRACNDTTVQRSVLGLYRACRMGL